MRSPKRSSFILRLSVTKERLRFDLQNLKTGQRLSFGSWAEVREHLEQESRREGLR